MNRRFSSYSESSASSSDQGTVTPSNFVAPNSRRGARRTSVVAPVAPPKRGPVDPLSALSAAQIDALIDARLAARIGSPAPSSYGFGPPSPSPSAIQFSTAPASSSPRPHSNAPPPPVKKGGLRGLFGKRPTSSSTLAPAKGAAYPPRFNVTLPSSPPTPSESKFATPSITESGPQISPLSWSSGKALEASTTGFARMEIGGGRSSKPASADLLPLWDVYAKDEIEEIVDPRPPITRTRAIPIATLPPTPPLSLYRQGNSPSSSGSSSFAGRRDSDWSHVSTASSESSFTARSPKSARESLRAVAEAPEPLPKISHDKQKVFDTATRMLCKSLELTFVYLIAVDLTHDCNLTLLSSHGLPTPPPTFEPSLHFKALRAPEGGIVYQRAAGRTSGFASGLLVPVKEFRNVGFILAGYSAMERDFLERDMSYFVKFASHLETWCAQVDSADL